MAVRAGVRNLPKERVPWLSFTIIRLYSHILFHHLRHRRHLTPVAKAQPRIPQWAVFLLLLSGLCDAFDGKVARTRENPTRAMQNFGIQIDSLADIVGLWHSAECASAWPCGITAPQAPRRVPLFSPTRFPF
ncbi:MAG: CDP-alcohol phosphatidyltransferase family protein [Oscillospiraceae bacterium]